MCLFYLPKFVFFVSFSPIIALHVRFVVYAASAARELFLSEDLVELVGL
jgi:hypothetical protein